MGALGALKRVLAAIVVTGLASLAGAGPLAELVPGQRGRPAARRPPRARIRIGY
jgi:hypothetical protein